VIISGVSYTQYLRILIFCAAYLAFTGLVSPAFAGGQGASAGEAENTGNADLGDEDLDDELSDEFALLEDSKVVESAAKHRQEIGMSPSAITVITRKDIETSGAGSIPDLLRMVPGMDVVITTPYITTITSRMFWTNENNHYLVLVDGREANIELLGQPPWEVQPISLEDIERIEVIRGPGSSLYGANAMAGVISIITHSALDKTAGWARVLGGEIGTLSAGGQVATRLGDFRLSLGGGYDYTGMFDDFRRLGKRVWKARSVLEYRWSENSRLLLDAGLSRGQGPVPSSVGSIDGVFDIRVLRLACETKNIKGQLYWSEIASDVSLRSPLDYGGLRLATFKPIYFDSHTLDGQVQWTLPEMWEPLLLIVGGGGRLSLMMSDDLLDGSTFSDPTSSGYHKPGIEHFEMRVGAFVHGELALVDWMTITGGLRFDSNTVTGVFLSPRLAAVFRPAAGQFLRLGVARSFRKPAFLETGAHPMAVFPTDGPIAGSDRDKFLEFLTRVGGGGNLASEKLLSVEIGYLGQFLEDRLSVSLDLYYNLYTDQINMVPRIFDDPTTGLPDLDLSSFRFESETPDIYIIGSEFNVRFDLSKSVSLQAGWTYREVFERETGKSSVNSPKNLLKLGGSYSAAAGFLGSLFFFTRSSFIDPAVEKPGGLLEGLQDLKMGNDLLVMGKLGWRMKMEGGVLLETGVRLLLPVSFSAPYFHYYEKGGGITADGLRYGGQELRRVVTVYLKGSF